jgi:3-oxoacyl-[acyl-carrier protein] reductase
MNLKNKVVVITGANMGIGRATALAFARKGANVVITYKENKRAAQQTLRECQKHGEAILCYLDVRDEQTISKALKYILKEFGRVDVLVNNAGVIRWKRFIKQTMRDIEEQLAVNLLGLIKVTRIFLPQMIKQRRGIIVNIASGAGKEGFEQLTVYCATKFGVRGFTQALALELPKGVRTYCVNPGMTATRMTGYRGVPPERVAGVIVETAEETLGKRSGEDVDVWEYI